MANQATEVRLLFHTLLCADDRYKQRSVPVSRCRRDNRCPDLLASDHKINAMAKMRVEQLQPELERELLRVLTQEGKMAAIKLYIQRSSCRPREARRAIDRLSHNIEPGQAT